MLFQVEIANPDSRQTVRHLTFTVSERWDIDLTTIIPVFRAGGGAENIKYLDPICSDPRKIFIHSSVSQ